MVTKEAGATTKKKKAAVTKTTKSVKKKSSTNKRKKPAPKDAAEILALGTKASAELAHQRAAAAAGRMDPLWYRIEDCANTDGALEHIPVVEQCLQQQGISRQDVTPQAMACLLEEAVRYSNRLIETATECAAAAGRADMTRADVVLAQELTGNQPSTTHTTPRLLWVSQQVNRHPLPAIPNHCCNGVVIGQPLQRTWDLVSAATVERKSTLVLPTPKQTTDSPGYGAVKGKTQIPINLKTKPAGDSSKK